MKRKIIFGEHSAILCFSEHRAKLTLKNPSLPVQLADFLNNAGDISVLEVFKQEDVTCMRMNHHLSPSDILVTVCEAIGEVYDVDTSVLYA